MEYLKQYSELITIFLSTIISIATIIYVIATFLMLRVMDKQRKDNIKTTYENQILGLESIKVNLLIMTIDKPSNTIETQIESLEKSIIELEKKIEAI